MRFSRYYVGRECTGSSKDKGESVIRNLNNNRKNYKNSVFIRALKIPSLFWLEINAQRRLQTAYKMEDQPPETTKILKIY